MGAVRVDYCSLCVSWGFSGGEGEDCLFSGRVGAHGVNTVTCMHSGEHARAMPQGGSNRDFSQICGVCYAKPEVAAAYPLTDNVRGFIPSSSTAQTATMPRSRNSCDPPSLF